MTQVWDMDLPTTSHKLLLLAFADFANDEGLCYPSQYRLQKKTGLSRRHTQRLISSLKQRGQLKIIRAATSVSPPLYRVMAGRHEDAPRGDILSDGGRHGDALTVIEPSVEPSASQAKTESVVVDTTTSLEGGER